MSYLSLGRAYLQFDWSDPYHGFRIAFGIWPKSGLIAEEVGPRVRDKPEDAALDALIFGTGMWRYGQDVTSADVGSYGGTDPDEDMGERLRAVMPVEHCPHAIQYSNATTPAGAQSFEPVAQHATRIPNPPSRDEE